IGITAQMDRAIGTRRIRHQPHLAQAAAHTIALAALGVIQRLQIAAQIDDEAVALLPVGQYFERILDVLDAFFHAHQCTPYRADCRGPVTLYSRALIQSCHASRWFIRIRHKTAAPVADTRPADTDRAVSGTAVASARGTLPIRADLLGICHGSAGGAWPFVRSEEHTSELQSRFDLVCR